MQPSACRGRPPRCPARQSRWGAPSTSAAAASENRRVRYQARPSPRSMITTGLFAASAAARLSPVRLVSWTITPSCTRSVASSATALVSPTKTALAKLSFTPKPSRLARLSRRKVTSRKISGEAAMTAASTISANSARPSTRMESDGSRTSKPSTRITKISAEKTISSQTVFSRAIGLPRARAYHRALRTATLSRRWRPKAPRRAAIALGRPRPDRRR